MTATRARGLIQNPILNSPFVEPSRHFAFTDQGITDTIVDGRRKSAYLIPIPQPKKREAQQQLTLGEVTNEKREEIALVNGLRDRVARWRQGRYPHVERRTRHLLEHWQREERERRLFFCQIEAVETAIYLSEAAARVGDDFGKEILARARKTHGNDLLDRFAFKMATGSGKTLVMAMLIAWQGLNKLASPDDKRFSKNFLIVTPGITIRDRLRVLLLQVTITRRGAGGAGAMGSAEGSAAVAGAGEGTDQLSAGVGVPGAGGVLAGAGGGGPHRTNAEASTAAARRRRRTTAPS
jgi:type III restriction enzyme